MSLQYPLIWNNFSAYIFHVIAIFEEYNKPVCRMFLNLGLYPVTLWLDLGYTFLAGLPGEWCALGISYQVHVYPNIGVTNFDPLVKCFFSIVQLLGFFFPLAISISRESLWPFLMRKIMVEICFVPGEEASGDATQLCLFCVFSHIK